VKKVTNDQRRHPADQNASSLRSHFTDVAIAGRLNVDFQAKVGNAGTGPRFRFNSRLEANMSDKQSVMRIQLDARSKDRLAEICEKRGMTHIAALTRIVEWFSRQDEVIQTSVLHNLSQGSLSAIAKSQLKKL
jgi:hypothetical protein